MNTTIHAKNIIWNSKSAIAECARVAAEQPIANKKNRIWNVCFALLFFLLVPCSMLGSVSILLPELGADKQETVVCMGVALLLVLGISFVFYAGIRRPVLQEWEWYSHNAQYYRIIKDVHPLSHSIVRLVDNYYRFYVEYEDDEHVVSSKSLDTPLKSNIRTDISEITVDLTKGEVCFPYGKM